MSGLKSFLYTLGFILFIFLAVFSIREWKAMGELKETSQKALIEKKIMSAKLAGELIKMESLDVLAPYPLFEFAKKSGFRQVLVLDMSGHLLNDTLSSEKGALKIPRWVNWSEASRKIENEQVYYQAFREQGADMEAILLPFSRNEETRPLVLAFITEKDLKEDLPVQNLVIILVLVSILMALAYAFLRNYGQVQKELQKSPSEVGFVVDTFHDLVGKLKENERELMVLRKLAEERAHLVESSSENILQSVASGVISLDGELRITKINSRAEKILELTREEILGKKQEDVIGSPLKEYLAKTETVERGELIYVTPSGKRLWLGFSITPLLNGTGDWAGNILVFTDLTELKALERQAELRKRLSSLGEISAGVAHELRNPMAVISGYSRMLTKKLPENLKQAALAIEKEIEAMDSIINGFLSFARPKEPVFADIALENLLKDCLKAGTGTREDLGIILKVNPPELTFKGDELLLRQAFTNLIRNAGQAMPSEGRLTVEAEKIRDEVSIRISDTGHGIPENIREKIFLPFYTTKEGGTGLGLPIVHSIVQSHNGTIEIESSSAGTTFLVKIPLSL